MVALSPNAPARVTLKAASAEVGDTCDCQREFFRMHMSLNYRQTLLSQLGGQS
jgi:hypothetical protein